MGPSQGGSVLRSGSRGAPLPQALQVIGTMAIGGGGATVWSAMTHAGTVERSQKVRVPPFHMTQPSTQYLQEEWCEEWAETWSHPGL